MLLDYTLIHASQACIMHINTDHVYFSSISALKVAEQFVYRSSLWEVMAQREQLYFLQDNDKSGTFLFC